MENFAQVLTNDVRTNMDADGEDASNVDVEVDQRVIVIDRRTSDSED